jgi:TonB-linked SusC/RagA family outer membrane protein
MSRIKNLYKYSIIVLIGIISFSTNTSAQSQEGKVIKGTITDQATKESLPGASVIIKNEDGRLINGVLTDLDGRYTIKVSIPKAILQISYMGYKPQEFPVSNQQVIDAQLVPNATELQAVVVTASDKSSNGFLDVDKRNRASSVATVDLNKVSGSSATSVGEMMQGRAAGVQITSNSGDPGAGLSIKIRGTNSLNSSNNPLVVVDGIEFPVDGPISVSDLANHANSALGSINSEDIETLDILKDAAALAIYGSKAANGVILITTKRGKKNTTLVNFSSNGSFQQAPPNPPLLSGNDLKTLILEGNQNNGQIVYGTNVPLPQLRDDQTRNDYYYYSNNTDWVKAIQQTGSTLNNNLSLRGGGNATRYSFSIGTVNQKGNFIQTGYNRLTTNVALDYDVSKKLFFKTDIGFTNEKTDHGGQIGNGHDAINGTTYLYPIDMARKYLSFLPIHEKDKNGNDLPAYYIPNPLDNSLYPLNIYNPVAWSHKVPSITKKTTFFNNLSVIYEILEGLRFTGKLGVNFIDFGDDAFIPSEATNRNWDDNMINHSIKDNESDQSIQQTNTLSYTKTINEKHELSFALITEINWYKKKKFFEESSNSGSSLLHDMNATNVWTLNNNLSSYVGNDAMESFRGNFSYVYNDKYILQGTVDYEGSSKFGQNQRYAIFPTIAPAWRISRESFLKDVAFINDIKFRYSWGKSGKGPNDQYLYFNTYSSNVRYNNEPGVTPDNIQLNNLKWETTTQNDLGLDMAVWNNRISITIDVYDKLTKDLLIKRTLPTTSGYGDFWTNFGTVRNKGIEFSLNELRMIDGKDLKWSFVNFNFSANKNKIEYLPADNGITSVTDNGYVFLVKQGDPIGSFYGLRYKGVFKTDADAVARDAKGNVIMGLDGQPKKLVYNGYIFKGGDAIYEDMNHDGVINDLDRTQIGDANPLFYGGFGTRLSYKMWTLDVFFQYQYGNQVLDLARKNLEAMPGGYQNYINQATSVLRRWREQGDVTDMPRVTYDPQSHNSEGSDRYVEDGSYLRLKSLALTYNLPAGLLKKVYIKNASVFINAYNWLTWTKYKGQDPEISLSNNTNSWIMGEDINQTPVPKSITAGFRLTF